MPRWDYQFYSVIIAVVILGSLVAAFTGIDRAAGVFLGALSVGVNFGALITIGNRLFTGKLKPWVWFVLLALHVFITPVSLCAVLGFTAVDRMAVIWGTITEATVCPFLFALLVLISVVTNGGIKGTERDPEGAISGTN